MKVGSRLSCGRAAALLFLSLAFIATATLGCGGDTPSSAQPTPTPTPNLIEQRMLAQLAFSVGLDSTVLQSQLQMTLAAIIFPGNDCQALVGGGSVKLISTPGANPATVRVYYDSACARRYISAVLNISINQQTLAISVEETADYFGTDGMTALGVYTLHESILLPAADMLSPGLRKMLGIDLSGPLAAANELQILEDGSFAPASGAPAVRIALACTVSSSGQTTLPCKGAIAQNFPALARALGFLAELNLSPSASGGVNFFGDNSQLVSGPLDSLVISSPSPGNLLLSGGSPWGNASISGSAATFSLFPPTPTSWTVTDTGHHQQIAVEVVSDAERNLTAAITDSMTGKTIATAILDQSGSGAITYSDGSMAQVASWLLAD